MLLSLIGIVIFIVSFVVTTAVTAWFVVRLPGDYFIRSNQDALRSRASASYWLRFVFRNLLAVVLVGLGIILSLPGIPGQGVLTVLLGIMISDFPGKERLERKIVSYPKVLEALNRLRERFGKPPLQV